MGAEYIDYLIADPVLILEPEQKHFAEKIVYLPHTYQANDSKRRISDRTITRAAAGLPQGGVVFCCFNNNHKITPDVFSSWMTILKAVAGSVLWLLEDNAKAGSNLRHEAERRGVKPERIVFAKRVPHADHLARQRLADLFLDTLPYNAHTTASDALWAGLPVLTCMGNAFAGRVAASLLNAIGLPELITSTPQAYEALAIDLATHPTRLGEIRRKLAANRLTTPLFDSQLFTRHIEAAYTTMYERYWADLPPDHIFVAR
jgi:predicted O-linked N-acetylglucosamine transferase (SPINDLY family)